MTDTKLSMWPPVIVAIAGLVVVAGVFAGALSRFTDSKDIVAVTGAVTGVVGTIVTAFFGIHATAGAGTNATRKVAEAGAAATQAASDAGAAATQAASNAGTAATQAVAAGLQQSEREALAYAGALDPEVAKNLRNDLHPPAPS